MSEFGHVFVGLVRAKGGGLCADGGTLQERVSGGDGTGKIGLANYCIYCFFSVLGVCIM